MSKASPHIFSPAGSDRTLDTESERERDDVLTDLYQGNESISGSVDAEMPSRHRQVSEDHSIENLSQNEESPTSRAQSILDVFSVRKISDYNRGEQINLIQDYKAQLDDSLLDLQRATKERCYISNAETYYQYGLIYKKLARVDDLLGEDEDVSYHKREKAIKYFDKAIRKSMEKDFGKNIGHEVYYFSNKESTAHKVLAKYYSTKAKCLYAMDQISKAEQACSDAITYNPTDCVAYEVKGYIYKAKGEYVLALEAFKQSEGTHKDNIHYVVSLYNQSITLAALGKQDAALHKLQMANNMSSGLHLETEDQILAGEMHNPEYEELIRELATIARKKALLNTPQNQSVRGILEEINIGVNYNKTIKISQELSHIMQNLNQQELEVRAKKTAHLRDGKKLADAIQRLESYEDLDSINKKDISADHDLNAFYKKLHQTLYNTYIAAQVISTDLVENNKTGETGRAAKIIDMIAEFLPFKTVALPAKLTALALENIDQYNQRKCIEHFCAIADSNEEMQALSEAVALKLTMQRKDSRGSQDINLKSHTNITEIKKISKVEALNTAKFISKRIFEGDLNKDDIYSSSPEEQLKSKVTMIVALVNLEQNYHASCMKDIPDYTKAISMLTLEEMKKMAIHWHINDKLENIFQEQLAYSIYKANLPDNVLKNQIVYARKLAANLFMDSNVIGYQHGTFKFWKYKAILLENFLRNEEFFNEFLIVSCDTSTVVSVDLHEEQKEDCCQILSLDDSPSDLSVLA